MQRIGVISTHHYPEYLEHSARFTLKLAASLRAQRIVFVTSRSEFGPVLRGRAARAGVPSEIRNHDNTGMEFGAYQRGLDRLLEHGFCDWVVVLNDTSSIHKYQPRAEVGSFVRHVHARPSHDMPVAVGVVGTVPRAFQLNGLRTNRWVASSLFALNAPACELIDRTLYRPELEALIEAGSTVERFFSPSLDPILRDHLASWLLDPGARDHWYGAAELGPSSAPRLAAKARSILQEFYLGATLNDGGAAFFDMCHLSRWSALGRGVETRLMRLADRCLGSAAGRSRLRQRVQQLHAPGSPRP